MLAIIIINNNTIGNTWVDKKRWWWIFPTGNVPSAQHCTELCLLILKKCINYSSYVFRTHSNQFY